MKAKNILICILTAVLLVSCGVKKKAAGGQPAVKWHTCLMQGGSATIAINGDQLVSAPVTMQTVHDSLLIISVMPLLGIEMVRFEATPVEITGFNKWDGTYATATYGELNKRLTPSLNWNVLQQTCAGELPTGDRMAHMAYVLGDKTIELHIEYPIRQLDVPVKMKRLNVNKYKKVDISKWL